MSDELKETKTASHVDVLVMPLWKIHPYLFSNGKFYVKYDVGNVEQILGTELNQHDDGMWHYHIEGDTTMFPVENAKALIARPISDMSDEELRCYPSHENWKVSTDIMMRNIIYTTNNNHLRSTNFLYMLSIGIYPFDQDHFETGEVIAKEA